MDNVTLDMDVEKAKLKRMLPYIAVAAGVVVLGVVVVSMLDEHERRISYLEHNPDAAVANKTGPHYYYSKPPCGCKDQAEQVIDVVAKESAKVKDVLNDSGTTT